MKKILYLLFLLPMAIFASCSNDDDLAEVDFSVTASGVTTYESGFYTVQGETVSIDNVAVKSLTDKSAGVTGVRFYLDGFPILGTIESPYTVSFDTSNLAAGTHSLSITATILQVDKTVSTAALNFPLTIVDSEANLPAGSEPLGTYTQTVTIQPKK